MRLESFETRHLEKSVHIKFEENGAWKRPLNSHMKIGLEIRKRQKGLMSGYTNASRPLQWPASTSVNKPHPPPPPKKIMKKEEEENRGKYEKKCGKNIELVRKTRKKLRKF